MSAAIRTRTQHDHKLQQQQQSRQHNSSDDLSFTSSIGRGDHHEHHLSSHRRSHLLEEQHHDTSLQSGNRSLVDSLNIHKPQQYSTDNDDDTDDDSSSNASSLDEDDVREVVKQVMMMVKHNRRSTSTAATQSNGRTQSSSMEGGGDLLAATRMSSLETTYNTTSASVSQSQPQQNNARLNAVLVSLASGSPTVNAPLRFAGGGSSNAAAGQVKELRSANVSTYASRVGIPIHHHPTTIVSSTTTTTVVSAAAKHHDASPPRHHHPLLADASERPSSAIRFSSAQRLQEMDLTNQNRAVTTNAGTPSKPKNLFAGTVNSAGVSPGGQQQVLTRGRHADRATPPPSYRTPSELARLPAAANRRLHDRSSHDAFSDTSLANMSDADQKRIARLLQQRAYAMREETFTPRTSLARAHGGTHGVSEAPETIRNIPTRGAGHWEDRLYTEYLSRKKHRELENEALRIAKETHKELTDALDECSFEPDLSGIHDNMRHWKKDSPAFSATGIGSRSNSAATLSKKERALIVTERLYKNPMVVSSNVSESDERSASTRKQQIVAPQDIKPTETQERLYEEHQRRQKEKQRLLEQKLKDLQVSSFVFQIKGNYYETLPLPQHADPGSFERLYKEGQKRQAKKTQAQEEALARRPSPIPEISEYARRRVRSAQPAFERLSTVKPVSYQQRSSSPPVCVSPMPQDGVVRNVSTNRPRGFSSGDPFAIPVLPISLMLNSDYQPRGSSFFATATPPPAAAATLVTQASLVTTSSGSVDHVLNWVNSTASLTVPPQTAVVPPIISSSGRVSGAVSRQESLTNASYYSGANNRGAHGTNGVCSPVLLTVLSPCSPSALGFPTVGSFEARSDGVLTAVGTTAAAGPPSSAAVVPLPSALREEVTSAFVSASSRSYNSAVNEGPSPNDGASPTEPDDLANTTRPPPALMPIGQRDTIASPHRSDVNAGTSRRTSLVLFDRYVEVSSESSTSDNEVDAADVDEEDDLAFVLAR
ncbi:Hypothetical protein, putative [Bodo saltans]|uniref:Uncharacterized protein n=1 Tax=Bodo saltans TaxID=75058 RepID=A0A0S4JDD8_BODSA|nr:Hypothetical protein, putative [Bodo saltans]|eukprot:CUG86972.1 Hypothetical protein, putative [Bodo saltans]